MSLSAGAATIEEARKDLLRAWERASRSWADAQQQRFESGYVEPIDADLRQAVAVMQQLAAILAQARRDCE